MENLSEEQEGMKARQGEMRKGRRERMRKGAISGYDKRELKHQNLVFSSL